MSGRSAAEEAHLQEEAVRMDGIHRTVLKALWKPCTAYQVAEATGYVYDTTRSRLGKLKKAGLADYERPMWSITDAGKAALASTVLITLASRYSQEPEDGVNVWQLLGGTGRPVRRKGRVIRFGLDKDRLGIDDDDTDAEVFGALAGTGLPGGSSREMESVGQG